MGRALGKPNKALLVLGFILQPNLRLLHHFKCATPLRTVPCSLFPVP
ncbi:MAG: hypothetical protein F6K56_42410 [Moorea sp. SIO3G5]|nr:hypothetical protein [Moorena sp. SIO3G5]